MISEILDWAASSHWLIFTFSLSLRTQRDKLAAEDLVILLHRIVFVAAVYLSIFSRLSPSSGYSHEPILFFLYSIWESTTSRGIHVFTQLLLPQMLVMISWQGLSCVAYSPENHVSCVCECQLQQGEERICCHHCGAFKCPRTPSSFFLLFVWKCSSMSGQARPGVFNTPLSYAPTDAVNRQLPILDQWNYQKGPLYHEMTVWRCIYLFPLPGYLSPTAHNSRLRLGRSPFYCWSTERGKVSMRFNYKRTHGD